MPGWLRRLLAPLERRWIRDPQDRERHAALVKRRLSPSFEDTSAAVDASAPASQDEPPPAAADVGPQQP